MAVPKKHILGLSFCLLVGMAIGSLLRSAIFYRPKARIGSLREIKDKYTMRARRDIFQSNPGLDMDIINALAEFPDKVLGHSKEMTEGITEEPVSVPPTVYTEEEKSNSVFNVTEFILQEINTENLSGYLKKLTSEPHLAGTSQDLSQAEDLQKFLLDSGFDDVKIQPYKVLLSYPDKEKPNNLIIRNENGEEIESLSFVQPPLHTPEENHTDITYAFNGYSGTGIAKGEIVYVYYGREEDFALVEEKGISLEGKIILARYGKTFRGNIASLAEKHGASSLLIYADPIDYAPLGRDKVYPETAYLPEDGIQYGTLKQPLQGDPLTPYYPALETSYRINQNEAGLPKIPVQPISYRHAEIIFQHMSEEIESPSSWHGTLNTSYPIGASLNETAKNIFEIEILTSNKLVTTYNVIGTLRGREEPDRYVLVGNHRDAWTLGSIDATSGSIVFMELARVFGKMKTQKGWSPRRSLVFCSWGAEEYGLVGSVEWVQQQRKVLQERAIAYLNVDLSISGFPGRFSLRASSTPLLYEAIYEAAKLIPNPNTTEVQLGRTSLYDTWLDVFPNVDGTSPKIGNLGTGSDYGPFIHNIGVTAVDMIMTTKKLVYGYPLYHTLYETHHLVENILDPGFIYHRALGQFLGELTRNIADSPLIPFNVTNYSHFLHTTVLNLNETHQHALGQRNITFEPLFEAIDKFQSTSEDFHSSHCTDGADTDLLSRRKINDQLKSVESSFIVPFGLPDRPLYNHIVYVPSIRDFYKSQAFSALTDFITIAEEAKANDTEVWNPVRRHLDEISYYISSATSVLNDYV